MKFDPDAAAYPFCFVGVVARGKSDVLKKTIDKLIADPGNVTAEEALAYWAVNSTVFNALKSKSATDVSEAAFKLHCCEITRLKAKVSKPAWEQWEKVADAADIIADLADLEAEYSNREIRRTQLLSALFFEGLKRDQPGRVRNATLYRTSMMSAKVSKHFLDTGKTLSGEDTDAEAVAAVAAAAKTVPAKRPRVQMANQRDQMSVRHALLVQTLTNAGIPLADDALEREFVKAGPNAVSAMMNDLNTVVDHKRRKLAHDSDMSQ